jgi:hypothetical protein
MDVNSLVRKWIKSRDKKPESDYEEAKRQFEMAIGKPHITLEVEIPAGFETLGNEFRRLEDDPQFHEEVKDLIKKRLLIDSRHKKDK